MPELIRNVAAWFSTDEAVDWLKLTNQDGEMLLRRFNPEGVVITASAGTTQINIGIKSEDLVRLGRYILAVAAAQGQNINQGFEPGGRN